MDNARSEASVMRVVTDLPCDVQSGKVVVYGAFDRTGTALLRTMETGPFNAVVEVMRTLAPSPNVSLCVAMCKQELVVLFKG